MAVVVAGMAAFSAALVVEQPCCATLRHMYESQPARLADSPSISHAHFGRRVGSSDDYKNLELVAATPLHSCAPLRADLTGKIALVRRGDCNFAYKVLQAQHAHAKAVIVMDNHARPRNE
uniref:Secreted protein n=1 Tax=Achlya hypogyna TaxID=1202772 RepID=A0A0A7CLQ1_ACHHY|nr:secreted protein [Achlya hypogyna]